MPKDWRGNVRYLLKQLFRWRLNCTEIAQASDRRAVFPHHYPKRTPTANLLKEPLFALPKIVLFYALPQVLPHLRAHQKDHFSMLLSFTKSVVKKTEEDVSSPRTPRMSCWDHFAIHSLLLLNLRGFSSKRQGSRLKRPTYFFSAPSHGDTPSLRISFTSQTLQKSQRLHSTSPFLSMTKTLFVSSRRRSCYQCMPFSHSGGQVLLNNR